MEISKSQQIREMILANPAIRPSEVAAKTGTKISLVYAVKRNLMKKMKIKKKASSPSKGQEVLREVLSDDAKKIVGLLNVVEDQVKEINRLKTIVDYFEGFIFYRPPHDNRTSV